MPKSDHIGEPTKLGCFCLYIHPLCSNSKAFNLHMCLGWCLTNAKHTTTDLYLILKGMSPFSLKHLFSLTLPNGLPRLSSLNHFPSPFSCSHCPSLLLCPRQPSLLSCPYWPCSFSYLHCSSLYCIQIKEWERIKDLRSISGCCSWYSIEQYSTLTIIFTHTFAHLTSFRHLQCCKSP